MARAVELVSGPSKSAGFPLHGLLVLIKLVQPPSGHCCPSSQLSADPTNVRASHARPGQGGQCQSLAIRTVIGRVLDTEQPFVGAGRSLRGQEARDQIRSSRTPSG